MAVPLACLLVACAGEPSSGGPGLEDVATLDQVGVDAGCQTHGDCPDSGAPCTVARCTPGGCLQQPLTGTPCSDGQACTGPDTCVDGACKAGPNLCECTSDARCAELLGEDACLGTPYCDTYAVPHVCRRKLDATVCDPSADTVCAKNACDPKTGACDKRPVIDGTPCDDGQSCTGDDACTKGVCYGPTPVCACLIDADCKDDGDPCNGQPYCDTGVFPHTCKTNPATVTTCPSKDVGPCKALACDATDGQCKTLPVADGIPCSSGSACKLNETCEAGACQGGVDVCACLKSSDCAKLEDGDLCNGVLYCDQSKGSCVVNPATVVSCPSAGDTACLKNLCNPATGTCAVTPVKVYTLCDDGQPCTQGDVCVGGACKPGKNTCACKTDGDCVAKEDGNACNGQLFCNAGTCQVNPATVKVCPAGEDTDCVKNACVVQTGACVPTQVELALERPAPNGVRWEVRPANMPQGATAVCDDGDPCTLNDLCDKGVCKPEIFGCACKSDGDCADDGDVCNGSMYCDKSDPKLAVCKPKPNTAVVCKTVDDTACLKNLCQPKTGQCQLTALAAGAPCEDGNVCTKSDYCVLGGCTGGAMVCDCQQDSDCAGKEDGDACNGTLYCDKSDPAKPACKVNPATLVSCPAQAIEACQQWTCNKTTGQCLLVAGDEGKPCDDGSACTSADVCKGGACKGQGKSCDDGDACTADTCGPTGQCAHAPVNCADGNDCTADVCDSKTGQCVHSALAANGKPCDADGSGCTVNDQCDAGTCKAGQPVSCPKGQGACVVGVCASLGAYDFKCVTTTAKDGAPCDDGDSCTVGSTCVGGSCKATGAEVLYDAVHTPKLGVRGGYRAVAGLPDGGAVAGGWSAAPLSGSATWTAWWVTRADAAGEPVWRAHLPSAKPHANVGVAGVRATSTGQLLAVGSRVGAEGHLDGWAAAWSAAGKLLWSASVGEAKVDDSVTGAQPWPTGGFVAAGWRTSAGALDDGVVTRISGGGQVVWRTPLAEPKVRARLADAAPRPDGGVYAAGWDEGFASGKRVGQLVGLGPTGKVQWRQRLGTASTQVLSAVVTLPGGDALAVGRVGNGAGAKRWLTRWSAAGQLRWSKQQASASVPYGATAGPSGRVLMVGASPSGSSSDLWLWATDALANQVWDGGFAGPGVDVGVEVWTDGSAVLAAGEAGQAGQKGLLIRRDAWGHGTCAASGGCEQKASAACDDGKPCTVDACAKGSCSHAPAVGWTCALDDGCTLSAACVQGACVGQGQGRLSAKEVTGTSPLLAKMVSAAPLPGGGGLYGLQNGTGGSAGYSLLRTDAAAATVGLGSQHKSIYQFEGLEGIVPLGDGSVVSVWRQNGGEVVAARYKQVGNQNTLMWQKTLCTPVAKPESQDCAKLAYVYCGSGPVVLDVSGTHVTWVGTSAKGNIPCKIPSYNSKYTQYARHVARITVATGAVSKSWSVYTRFWKDLQVGLRLRGTDDLVDNRAQPLSDGTLMLLGRAHVSKPSPSSGKRVLVGRYAYLERRNASTTWRKFYGGSPTTNSRFEGVATTATGLLAAGRRWTASWSKLWLVGVDTGGNQLWTREQDLTHLPGIQGVLSDPAGAILFGHRASSVGVRPWLRAVDGVGQTLWERVWTSLPKSAYHTRGGWRGPGGDVILAGQVTDQGQISAFQLRASPWGHATCAEAGSCSKQSWLSCDDQDPCTADLCDGKTGKCASQKSSGAPCDDGDACTEADTCVVGTCKGAQVNGCGG